MQAAPEIKQIGHEAARDVAGPEAIDDVEVLTGLNWTDEPTYEFYFRVDPARVSGRLALVHNRLSRRLAERLQLRGDDRLPVVHLLDWDDWSRFTRA